MKTKTNPPKSTNRSTKREKWPKYFANNDGKFAIWEMTSPTEGVFHMFTGGYESKPSAFSANELALMTDGLLTARTALRLIAAAKRGAK